MTMGELSRFLHTHWIDLLVAGVYLQSVVGAAIARDWGLLALTGLGGLVLLVAVFWLAEQLQRRRAAPLGVGAAFTIPRRGLILTVGGQKDTALIAIQSLEPEWLGLLCSRQTEAVAEEILAASGLSGEHVQKEIADAWDIIDVRNKTDALFKWLVHKENTTAEIAVDITGGTTPMSVGAFTMAEEWGIDTQYVRSRFDAQNKPIPKTQDGIVIKRHTGAAE